jgi:hypothetical protein
MPHHLYGLDTADWLQLATTFAAWLLVLAAYGFSVVAAAESRRPI